MSSYTKYFGLLLGSVSAALCAAPAFAMLSSTADELYSETMYIQKSSAEVPTALASNGSPSAEMGTSSSVDAPLESMEAVDAVVAPKAKKVSSRRHSKR